MGGAVSAGEDNDDLVDNLVSAKYIRSKKIIEIFRAVDRGHYYLKGQRNSAYHDVAWKYNHLHLSAPCIYSEVMEHLDLKPGQSFLNLGSGTGYLSTMAGLVLGPFGINHGVEIHADVITYAEEKLEEFMLKCNAFDKFDFCEPQFVVGNCLQLPPDMPGYDRVYCGAACPPEYANYLMNLLNIGGRLVLPLDDQLQIKTRTSEQTWDSESALAVSFAYLITPVTSDGPNNNGEITKLPERKVATLQQLCRFCIRQTMRKKYAVDVGQVRKKKKRQRQMSEGLQYPVPRSTASRHRRRRMNTTGESSARSLRRRINTSGESEHLGSSDSNAEDSDEEIGIDDSADQAMKKELQPEEEAAEDKSQSDLANTTKDISLVDKQVDKEIKETDAPIDLNYLPEHSKPDQDSKKLPSPDNGKAEGKTKSNGESKRSKKSRFLFHRKKKNSEGEKDAAEEGSKSSEKKSSGDDADTGGNRQETERENPGRIRRIRFHSRHSGRLVYALMHSLGRMTDEEAKSRLVWSTAEEVMTHAVESNDERSEEGERSHHSSGDESSSVEEDPLEDKEDDEDNQELDNEEEEDIFQPLVENQFTISIRKLPLPPTLISFLLYHRQ